MRIGREILLVALLVGQAAALCNLPRPRLVCAEYFQSKAVVVAKLAGATTVKDAYGDVTGTYYSMTVEQTFRGQVARLFRIYDSNDSGRTTFDWKTGDTYLLFLLREDPNGRWVVDGCGNSGPSKLRQTALEHIEAIDSTSNRGMIQGSVGGISSSYPSAGVQVEARGPGGVTEARTRADGTFEMHVAPGKYQLQVLSPGKTFVSDDFSYENPDHLVLENGGCAQVQFIESKKSQ